MLELLRTYKSVFSSKFLKKMGVFTANDIRADIHYDT